MTTPLEQELSHVLTAVAETTPPADEAFAAAVRSRERQLRRQRTSMIAVASAVVLVTVATITVAAGQFGRRSPVPPGTSPSPVATSSTPNPGPPDLGHARPAQLVWPQAVRRLPGRLPDGRRYELVSFVDEQHAVVAPNTGRQSVLLWSPNAGTVRELGHLIQPAGQSQYRIGGIWVTGDYVAWIVGRHDPMLLRSFPAEVWVAPLAGGAQRRLITVAMGYDVRDVTLTDRDLIIQLLRTGLTPPELIRVPLAGGAPTTIPDSSGYTLLATAPWAVRPTDTGPHTQLLWNLQTGEHRSVATTMDPKQTAFCSPEWCVSTDEITYSVVQRWDGGPSVRTTFPAWLDFTTNPDVALGTSPVAGLNDTTRFVWNLRSGTLGTWHESGFSLGMSAAAMMPSWLDSNGDLIVLDPSAIT